MCVGKKRDLTMTGILDGISVRALRALARKHVEKRQKSGSRVDNEVESRYVLDLL